MSSRTIINGKKYGKYESDNITTIFYDDMYHSLNDEPAFSMDNGAIMEWYQFGKKHRDGDKPASIIKKYVVKDEWASDDDDYCDDLDDCSEIKVWYKNGLIHRDGDNPAYIEDGEREEWYQNGKLHRDDDKPARIYNNGDISFYKNGKLHRDNNLPAMISRNGKSVSYYKDGKLHRDNDQPAFIDEDRTLWYKNGILYHSARK